MTVLGRGGGVTGGAPASWSPVVVTEVMVVLRTVKIVMESFRERAYELWPFVAVK